MKYGKFIIKNKIQTIDIFIISWLLFFVLIQFRLHVLISTSKIILSFICLIMIGLRFFVSLKKNKNNANRVILGIILLLIIFITSIFGKKTYFLNNFRELLFPCILFLYTSFLSKDKEGIDKLFLKYLLILNIYFFINTIIMYLQINGHDELLDTTFYSELKFDYMSGLFGGNDGTHRVTLFAALVTILMLFYYKRLNIFMKCFNLIIYLFSIIFTTYLSTQNDNVSFFIFVPLSVIIYYLIYYKKIFLILKKAALPTCIIVCLYCILNILIINDVQGFGKILTRLNMTIFSYGNKSGVLSNTIDERALLFSIALKNGNCFGQGIGAIKILGEETISNHFGMASAQSLVYIIGIVPYILYIIFIASGYTKKMPLICLSFIVYIFATAYYTQVLTVFNSTILFSIILMLMGRVGYSEV